MSGESAFRWVVKQTGGILNILLIEWWEWEMKPCQIPCSSARFLISNALWSLLPSYTWSYIPLPCIRSWDPATSLFAHASDSNNIVELPILLVDTWGIFSSEVRMNSVSLCLHLLFAFCAGWILTQPSAHPVLVFKIRQWQSEGTLQTIGYTWEAEASKHHLPN